MGNRTAISILFVLILLNSSAAQNLFTKWPVGSTPLQVGEKLTDRFLLSPHGVYNAPGTKPHIPYFEVCTWYGSLAFIRESKDKKRREQLVTRFAEVAEKDTQLLPVPDHVDYSVFGALPLEIFLQTGEMQYFDLGKMYADTQWGQPAGPRVVPASYRYYNKGYTWQTRLWIDDMYMITLLQAQAFRATGDRKYIDRAAREMVFYLDSLQKPNGLFYHAPASPFYWGRGNGWMAAGMTELLRALPADNPNHARIMQGYSTMMRSLLQYQADDGMWRQLVDDAGSWKETSCTGMFTFAMLTGVKMGWLRADVYSKAARKAWIALTGYINENGEITEVCEGTGAGNNKQYYLDRKRITGDFHGQAPVLWCAAALLRK